MSIESCETAIAFCLTSRMERGTNFPCKIAKRRRLLKENDSWIQHTVMDDRIAAISSCKHHRQSQSLNPCLVRKLAAIHLRHDNVGEQHRHIWALLDSGESRNGSVDGNNRISELF